VSAPAGIVARDLVFRYRPGPPVLRGVSLAVGGGKVTALFGPNGSGKSTLIRCLNGTLLPESGEVLLCGRPLAGRSPREVARSVAVVAQEMPGGIPFTALETVIMGRFPHGRWPGRCAEEDERRARECLERVGAGGLAGRRVSEMSGGERQRVAIARALAQDAPVFLLDEPSAHLDINHRLHLLRTARALAAEGRAVLMACHDLAFAPLFSDEAILMHRGEAVAAGPPAEVLTAANLAGAFGCAVDFVWRAPGRVEARLPPER
jgi:iron complex transport system ATP-binding protein